MTTREEALALFQAKYASFQSDFPSVGPFDENKLSQMSDDGWIIDFGNAAFTLRSGSREPHETHGGIYWAWRETFDERTGEPARLGHPISDEEVYEADGDSSDRISHFEKGDIVWTAKANETRIQGIRGNENNESSPLQSPPSPVATSVPATEIPPAAQQSSSTTWALPESAKRLKNLIVEKLDEIDKIASGMLPAEGEISEDWKKAAKKAREIREKLQPYLDAFESQAFFIVTFGMLKAGKSTLVNALVGKPDVSPVGHGRETTKRSSIIFAADDEHPEGVYIYTPKGCAKEGENIADWRRKKCEALILALGGVGKVEDEFDVEGPKRLSGKEMDELLTSKPDEEELPPVIRIQPGGAARFSGENLLKDGVAILDTPGLDGIDVNATNDAFWQVLPAQGDFFLLVQSSMSGLNDDCATQIAKIYGMTENKPGILIVYNEIAAQFWLDDEVQKRKLKKDQQEVQSYLRGKLREVSQGAATDIVSVNAGAASAALFGNEEEFSGVYAQTPSELLKLSCIGELTAKLRRMLRNQRTQIKLNRLKGLMGKELDTNENDIKQLLISLPSKRQDEFEEAEKRRRNVEEAAKRLKVAFHDPGQGDTIVKDMADAAENAFKPHQEAIDAAINTCQPTFIEKGIGEWAPQQECCDAIEKAIFQLNADFSSILATSIGAGTSILGVHPWKGFHLSDELQEAVVKISQYLGNSRGNATEDFLAKLLGGMTPQGITDKMGYHWTDNDKRIPGSFWGKLLYKNLVEKKNWDTHTRIVKSRLRRHFGLVQGVQTAPAVKALKQYVKDSILGAGRQETAVLANRVAEKVRGEEAKETIWKNQNDHVVAALTQILSIAGEIHSELKKD